jgi:hypothetical protein
VQPLELVVEVELLTLAPTQLEVLAEAVKAHTHSTLQSVVLTVLPTQEAVVVEVCQHQVQLEDLLEVQVLSFCDTQHL